MIPSMRWSQVLADQLSLAIAPPNTNWPMFFVDSEGMGIRGDAFDFITTSPPAVIAKVKMKHLILSSRILIMILSGYHLDWS